jgi:acetyl esterase
VICDLDTHDQPCRFLAREVPAMVLSVDYRLGPEHRFPAAVEDSLAAHAWAQENAERLGADPGRVAVAGDSAGGNLAAVVAQLAAAHQRPPVHQTLIYPVIDYSVERPSYELFAEGFFLTREEMHWFRDHYLTDDADRLDPRVSPILTEGLAGLAPAHVVTCGFDPLRDEGEAYAQRLREAGVPTTLVRERDLVHGFVNAAGLGGRAAEATAAIAAAIGTALATRPETAPATLTSPPG